MKDMHALPPSTQLLTMINVNQARPTKRARAGARDWGALARKVAKTSEKKMEKEVEKGVEVDGLKEGEEESDDEVEEEVVGKGGEFCWMFTGN